MIAYDLLQLTERSNGITVKRRDKQPAEDVACAPYLVPGHYLHIFKFGKWDDHWAELRSAPGLHYIRGC